MPQVRKFKVGSTPIDRSINSSSNTSSFRGFSSIDQEMEREIAMQWFLRVDRSLSILKRGSYKMR